MKKLLVLIVTLLCLFTAGQLVSAHHGPPPPPPGGPGNPWRPPPPDVRMRARDVLDETRGYLDRARYVAAPYGPERDRLDRAFDHQRYARDLFSQGFYHRAIDFSLRAREIARSIIDDHDRHRPGGPPPPPPPHHGHDDDEGSSINIRLRL